MKDTFILKTKYGSIINRLSDKQAGVLFKMLFNYVENGANAGSTDERVDMAFEFIKMDLDAFAESYQKKLTGRSEQGRLGNLKRWNRDLYDRVVSGELTLEKAEETIEATNLSLSDKNIAKRQNNRVATSLSLNDNDNVNDNDNDFSFLEKKKQKSASVKKSGIEEIDFQELSVETLKEEKEKNSAQKEKEKSSVKAFTPPSAAEVAAYCRERGNDISPESFCSFYASKGWRVGNQPMKDWRAAIRHWETRRAHENKQQAFPKNKQSQPLVIDENGNILSAETNNNTTQANTYVAGRQTAASLSANLQGW